MSSQALTIDGTAGRSLSAAPSSAAIQQLRNFTSQPAFVKSLPALAFLALAGLAMMVWMTVSAPPSRSLFQGLPDADKAAVADVLTGADIAYEVDRDTGSIQVSDSDYHRAKMLLAQQGLPKSAPDANSMISSLPLGASRAVEGERLRQAREADLSRTIEAIDAVQNARVHVAQETPSVFLRDNAQSSASVMLTLRSGRALSEQQVQAIVHLVASSVPGMSSDRVSVVDQSGRLLSSESTGNGGGDVAEKQVAIQAQIEERYLKSIETLLTPIVGAGNFTAQVHADIDFSETQATREVAPNERALAAGTPAPAAAATAAPEAGGIPGALSNQPPAPSSLSTTPPPATAPGTTPAAATPGTAAPTATANAANAAQNATLEREVSITRQQTGEVKRLSVAVALKKDPKIARDLPNLENLVKGAVGFNPVRGDVVALTARDFAPEKVEEPSWYEAGWVMPAARNATALVVVLLLVFGMGKPLMKSISGYLAKRAEIAAARQASMGREIAAAVASEARSNPDHQVTLDMIEAASDYESRAALIRNFVRQDPARAASVVRELIRSDGEKAE